MPVNAAAADLPAAASPRIRPLRWLGERGLPLALGALGLAAVLPLVVLWDQLPRLPGGPATAAEAPPTTAPAAATAAPIKRSRSTLVAADRLGKLLQEASRCAMKPQVQRLGPGASQLNAASLATLADCVDNQTGLSQVFLPPSASKLSRAQAVAPQREQTFGNPDAAYQQAVEEAVRTRTSINRPIPTGTGDTDDGVDLIVPPSGATSPPLMVLRLRWPRLLQDPVLKAELGDQQVRLLGDDPAAAASGGSAREGLLLTNAAGVRIVLGLGSLPPTAAPLSTTPPATSLTQPLLRWLLALVMLATLSLAAAAVFGMGRAHRRHQQQLQAQVQALQDKERQLEEDQRRITDMNERLRNQSATYLLGTRAGELLHKISNAAGACANACVGMQAHVARGQLDQLPFGVQAASAAAMDMQAIVTRFEPWLRAEPVLEQVSLHEVAAAALEQHADLASQHGVPTFNAVVTALPRAHADRLMLIETVSNLVKNALQAMADTPVHINRQLLLQGAYDDTLNQVRLKVQDRGKGIPPDLWEAIFEQGFRGRSTGSGWGLYVCRQWVERMGGSLRVRDSAQDGPDSGTCMEVTLPLPPAHACDPTPAARNNAAAP